MPEASKSRRAVVLLSGGLDSVTVLAIARAEGYAVHALSFRYGQRHVFELESAARQAARWGVEEHVFCDLSIGRFGGSALTDASIEVPQGRTEGEMSAGVPVTYVPARNTVFLAHALALAEVRGANDLFIGVNAIDYSGYPDCRPEFIAAFEAMARLATRSGAEGAALTIRAPLQRMTKADIVREGLRLGVDYADTHSCYSPDVTGAACGRCDACQLRLKGFEQAGVRDPARYALG
jgi:7-cyano-7-deazaguanine synthase